MPADDDNIAEFRSLQISLPETKNSDERKFSEYYCEYSLYVLLDRRKREGYLEWEDYFMVVAQAASMRSKDPSTQYSFEVDTLSLVGCVIVNKECKIVGTGYNGLWQFIFSCHKIQIIL
uniref:dCMP deaminase n=1 Tax=Heterorhabditis bacteriophora TaxID=37862 RepID=A0A1I7WVS9_HETBA